MALQRKKLTVELVKLKEKETITGRYVGQVTRPWTDDAGEEKELVTLIFEHVDENGMPLASGARFGLHQDSGLRLALEQAFVAPGDLVEIQKLEKKQLQGGRSVNQYDIYALEDPARPTASARAAQAVAGAPRQAPPVIDGSAMRPAS